MLTGSNHWIGNQTWAMQRIAELYYVAKNDEIQKSLISANVFLISG